MFFYHQHHHLLHLLFILFPYLFFCAVADEEKNSLRKPWGLIHIVVIDPRFNHGINGELKNLNGISILYTNIIFFFLWLFFLLFFAAFIFNAIKKQWNFNFAIAITIAIYKYLLNALFRCCCCYGCFFVIFSSHFEWDRVMVFHLKLAVT